MEGRPRTTSFTFRISRVGLHYLTCYEVYFSNDSPLFLEENLDEWVDEKLLFSRTYECFNQANFRSGSSRWVEEKEVEVAVALNLPNVWFHQAPTEVPHKYVHFFEYSKSDRMNNTKSI